MNFEERLAAKRAAISKGKKKSSKDSDVITGRKCGECGEFGHNSRTCQNTSEKPSETISKPAKVKLPTEPEVVSETPETPLPGQGKLGNRDYLQPPIKDTLEELKELLKHGEIPKPGRDDLISLDEFSSKRNPSKLLVMELKLKLDPNDLVNERYSIKKNLRDSGFRIPSEISTPELVQLAIKREVL